MPNPVAVPALIFQALMLLVNAGVAVWAGFPAAWISIGAMVFIAIIMAFTYNIGRD